MYWKLTLPHSKVRPESTCDTKGDDEDTRSHNLSHLLALVQVNAPLQPPAAGVDVVLEDELARHRSGPQLEPPPPPFLERSSG